MKTTVQQVKETAAEKQQREAEQARAEASRVAQTQANLDASTLARLRRFGKINPIAAGVPIALPRIGVGAGAGGSTVGGAGNFAVGSGFGGFGGFNGGGGSPGIVTALY